MSFGARLKEERKRLGCKQAEFAALVGTDVPKQSLYENGRRQLRASYLSRIAAAGVDVLYVLTGQRSEGWLDERAAELLGAWQGLPAELKAVVAGLIDDLGRPGRGTGTRRPGWEATGIESAPVPRRRPAGEAGMTRFCNTAEDAAELLRPALAGEPARAVAALHLDSGRRLIGLDVYPASPGGVEAGLPVRPILEAALRYDATILILGRNRPGGDPIPTESDRAATRHLAHAARLLDIRLEDHLVFGGGEWRSFRRLGLL